MSGELYTHEEVCEAMVSGRANVGLTSRYIAGKHGLRWIHVTWEDYECYALRDRMWKTGVDGLRRPTSPQMVTGLAEVMPGYKVKGWYLPQPKSFSGS